MTLNLDLMELITALTALAGLAVAYHRFLATKLDALHSRINDVREDFVHKDHMARHFETMSDILKELKDEQHRTNQRIDTILNQFALQTSGGKGQ